MARIARLVALASAFALATAQEPAALDPCAQNCVDSVKGTGAAFGCNGGEPSCICAKPDFAFGVRDCANQACAPDIVAQATNFVSNFCATATLTTVTTSATPPPEEPAPTTDPVPAERPVPSSAPQATVESPTTSSTAPPALVPVATQPSSSTPTALVAAPDSSATEDDDDEEEGEEEDDDDDQQPAVGGLSAGAKAGIGISVALIGTGLIGLAFWLHRRSQNRNSIRTGDFHISGPMPGSGRDYASSHLDYNKEGNSSELELRSRRYEDMVPRQQPASMI